MVAGRQVGPAAPGAVGLHDVLLRSGDHEVDDHGGAADHAGGGAGVEVLRGHRAHEGQLHVGVQALRSNFDMNRTAASGSGAWVRNTVAVFFPLPNMAATRLMKGSDSRSEEHRLELQSIMLMSFAVFSLK